MKQAIKWLLLIVLIALPSGCLAQPTGTPTPSVVLSLPELKYRLLSYFDDVFWCDPDFYPVGRPGQEEKNALEQFPAIKSNEAEFLAILARLALPNKAEYTAEEKVLIYREHKQLTYAVQITASGDVYQFTLRIREGQGERIAGTLARSGEIKVSKRESSFNTYPICLVRGTLIDTPEGRVPVEQLHEEMAVWTVDDTGNRVKSPVIETVVTPVPMSFQVIRMTLNDGRVVTASAGHPTAEGRALGDYQIGDTLDEALVASTQLLTYDGGATYDLLPSGATGLYWADGVLLKSTLSTKIIRH